MPSERKTAASNESKVGWVNGLLILALIALPALFGAFGKATEMGVMIVACSLALAFANIHRLQSFKGAGFEAQVRQVEEAVEDAYATIEQMHKLARPLVLSSVANLAYGGQWKGPSFALENQMMHDLQSVQATIAPDGDNVVEEMFRDFYRNQSFALADKILSKVGTYQAEELAVVKTLGDLCRKELGSEPPTVAGLRAAISGFSTETQQRLEPYILDYELYRQHRKLRRPETGTHTDY